MLADLRRHGQCLASFVAVAQSHRAKIGPAVTPPCPYGETLRVARYVHIVGYSRWPGRRPLAARPNLVSSGFIEVFSATLRDHLVRVLD
jgi:lambda repressor-like predicted transcriptional regulator